MKGLEGSEEEDRDEEDDENWKADRYRCELFCWIYNYIKLLLVLAKQQQQKGGKEIDR